MPDVPSACRGPPQARRSRLPGPRRTLANRARQTHDCVDSAPHAVDAARTLPNAATRVRSPRPSRIYRGAAHIVEAHHSYCSGWACGIRRKSSRYAVRHASRNSGVRDSSLRVRRPRRRSHVRLELIERNAEGSGVARDDDGLLDCEARNAATDYVRYRICFSRLSDVWARVGSVSSRSAEVDARVGVVGVRFDRQHLLWRRKAPFRADRSALPVPGDLDMRWVLMCSQPIRTTWRPKATVWLCIQ